MRRFLMVLGVLASLALLALFGVPEGPHLRLSQALAQTTQPTPEQKPRTEPTAPELRATALGAIVRRIDSEAKSLGNGWIFSVENMEVTLVYDTSADRMRVLVPIAEVAKIDKDELLRLMQANFDSALDARYAVANGVLWGVFIRPLNSLSDRDFLSGVGQTINVALTFGSSYSSGEMVFSGGDSQGLLRRRLIDDLLRKGQGV